MAVARTLARSAVAGLVLSALAVLPAGAVTVGDDGNPITNDAGTTFGILSHRGGAKEWPENSVEAFTASVAAGFDSIETDIVFTKDGRGVMSHYDRLPSRCTQAGKSIHKLSYAQVAKVRCANLDGAKVVPIPTFEELAAVLKGHPDVGLSLDIKSYSGQSASGKRSWAAKAMQLVKKHGLLDQTSVISFHWASALPTIRKYSKTTPVRALDSGAMDLDRVRLAAKLGATAFGVKMKYTSEYLANYVKAKGMDSTPWEVSGREQLAFAIHYGGRIQLFSTDTPTATRAELVSGDIDINPVPNPVTTTLTTPVTVSKATYKANQRQYPAVLSKAVPSAEVAMLRNVTLDITVANGPGTGSLYVGGSSTSLASSVKVALPAGTATLSVQAPLGDGGKLRIYTTKTVKLTVKVVGYTRVRFA